MPFQGFLFLNLLSKKKQIARSEISEEYCPKDNKALLQGWCEIPASKKLQDPEVCEPLIAYLW